MHISGSGKIPGGEYKENCSVSGSAKISGDLRCLAFSCSGAAKAEGYLACETEAHVSGSLHVAKCLQAEDICVSGSLRVGEDCVATDEVKISGALHCGGILKGTSVMVSGGFHVEKGVEAEEVKIAGRVICEGLLNAERTEIRLNGEGSSIHSIGGSKITVTAGKRPEVNSLISLFRSWHSKIGDLKVTESVEGDYVSLEDTEVPVVLGRIVTIGQNCKIGRVQYSERVKIDPSAQVDQVEKV